MRPFLDASGAQLLACRVGNVHGRYRGKPALDWPLLAAIRAQAGDVPLVLRGASGLPSADLAAGIGNVNVNTELRTATLAAIEQRIGASRAAGEDMLALTGAIAEAADGVARDVLTTLACQVAGTSENSVKERG